MEDVMLDIDGVIAYIDDFLYYSDTVEEHLVTLERVFKHLVKNNIFLHPLKCVRGVTKLNYLGLTISPGLVSVSEEKIAALKDCSIESVCYPARCSRRRAALFGFCAVFSCTCLYPNSRN